MPENLKDPELPEMLGLRLEPKTRYLAELAARAEGRTLSSFVEQAIIASFSRVTLRKPSEPEPMYLGTSGEFHVAPIDVEQERIQNEAMLVSNMADNLWSDNPFIRLEIRAMSLPHLMTFEDSQLWSYIHTRDEFKIKSGKGYKFNRELIAANWKIIKADAKKGA
jgi:hypothetical protein